MTTKDGQVEWKIKDGRTHHMCGEIVALVTTPPDYEHLLLCNGQKISADDYPELVKALGTNVLPNLNGRVLQGAETAGEYKEAGLPNIVGTISLADNVAVNKITDMTDNRILWGATGAFSKYQSSGNPNRVALNSGTFQAIAVNDWRHVNFNASRSNPIYGASTTVQPPAYTVKFYICWG